MPETLKSRAFPLELENQFRTNSEISTHYTKLLLAQSHVVGRENNLICGIAFYNWCVKVTDLGKYECNARLNQTKSPKQFTASTLPALHQVNEISKLTTSKTIKSSKKQARKPQIFNSTNAKKLASHPLVLTIQYVYPFLHGI